MLASQARLFVQALIDRYVIDHDLAEWSLGEAARTGESVDVVLQRQSPLVGKDLAAAWSAAHGLQFFDGAVDVVHQEAAGVVPAELVKVHSVLGLSTEGKQLRLAVPVPADPASMHDALAAVAEATGFEVLPVGADRADLESAIADTFGGVPTAAEVTASHTAGELRRLFDRTIELGASDLHLAAGQPPFVRVRGDLVRLEGEPALTSTQVKSMIFGILTPRQQKRFDEEHELDLAYAIPGVMRFRVNVFVQRNAVGAAFRVIPAGIVPLENLGLPEAVRRFSEFPRGLVLVTGPTGSGKSTTLAALVDLVNQSRASHIMTVEDPIEFIHQPKMSLVNQREVGEDTASFGLALRQAMRQDPDVILVGEMRDLETISTAISAAETGHLVFATLHTQDSAQTIDRIVDVFPASQQAQVRVQVASTLQGILCQQLVPTADGRGRTAACEILLATPATRTLIRDGKVHQIHNQIQAGKRLGMQSIDDSLADLVRRGICTVEDAMRRARNTEDIARQLGIQLPEVAAGVSGMVPSAPPGAPTR